MKYLKTYENINRPQIGDYIVLKWLTDFDNVWYAECIDFIQNNIGQITKKGYTMSSGAYFEYVVKYNKIPKGYPFDEFFDIGGNKIAVSENEIVFYSKDKKEAEVYLMSKKYNL